MRRARKSIAAFKLREGMPVGVAVTLRSERGYEFLDRLVSIAIPRIRDFRGLNPRSFDGRGNYSLGVREQIIFPEIDYDAVDEVRGLDITITTTAATDAEAFALLSALGLPFAAQGRPRGFDQLDGEPDDGQQDDEEPTDAVDATPQDVSAGEGDGETTHDAADEPQADANAGDASEGEAAQGEADADASDTDEQGETDKQGETADGEESD